MELLSRIRSSSLFTRVFGLSVGLVACLFAGCDPPQEPSTRGSAPAVAASQADHLAKVYDLLQRGEDFRDDRFLTDLLYPLNQWQDAQRWPENWKPDPLVERLPRSLKQFLTPEMLARGSFDAPDVLHLRESLLLRDVAQWVVRQPGDESLEAWIRTSSGLAATDADRLVVASRLFDWTIRNIQLDELLPYPQDDAAGPTGRPNESGAGAMEMPAPLRAQPGPGYQHEPLHVLLGGHGDAIERARIFALLARQQQIDVVYLAVYDLKTSPRPRPWAAGVLLNDRLYLFDSFLGLPLPGPGGAGIATLDDVRKDANYFDQLRGEDGLRYPFGASDMANLMALVDAAPLSLTHRMQMLEGALVGQQQAVLAVKPSVLGDRVRKLPGINNVGILAASWEAPLYRGAIMQLARVDSQAAATALAEEALFREASPVGQGRWRYLQGRFENEDREKGAKALFLAARVPDAILDRLQRDKEAQRQVELVRPDGMSDQAWQARMAAAEFLFRQSKMHASYWLGIVHLETQRADAAVEWFKKRTLESEPPSRWKNGARYNLARCYERQGRFAEARELYREDDSPQRLGNVIRARQLAARQAPKPPANATPDQPPKDQPSDEKPPEDKPSKDKVPEEKAPEEKTPQESPPGSSS